MGSPPDPLGRRVSAAGLASGMGILALLLALAFLFALHVGAYPVSMTRALASPDSDDAKVLFAVRLPRCVLAALVGAALAVTGATLQALLRNPLADPFVLGVSGGAALGATIALALGSAAVTDWLVAKSTGLPPPVSWLTSLVTGLSPAAVAAFAGAVGATVVVYGAGKIGGRLSPYAALLAGVIFNAVAASAITCVKALAPPERVGELLYWLAGTIGYERPGTLAALALLEAGAIGVLVVHASRLNLLALGDESAASLGVEVGHERTVLFLATSLAVAGAVSLSGLIGFVGLLSPHVLRLWLGADHRRLLPACCLGGAAFLVAADGGARLLMPAMGSAPVGVLTALIGGPLFLWLLRREGKRLAP